MKQNCINLMPVKYQQKFGTNRIRRQFTIYYIIGLAVIVSVWGYGNVLLKNNKSVINSMNSQLSTLNIVRTKSDQMNIELKTINEEIVNYNRQALPIETSKIISKISNLMPASIMIEELNLKVMENIPKKSVMEELKDKVKRSRGTNNQLSGMQRIMSIEIVGIACQDSDFPIFLSMLAGDILFQNVELDYDRSTMVNNVKVREFKINLMIDLDVRYVAIADEHGR